MRARRLAVVLTLAGASVWGCDSSPNGPTFISLDEFPAAFARRYCHRVYGCCRSEDRAVASPGTDEASCTDQMTENATDNATLLLSFGGVGYFGDVAERCLALLDRGACTDIFDPTYGSLVACQDVFAGTRVLDASCEDARQCLSGACTGRCAPPATCAADEIIGGDNQCLPRVAGGAACTLSAQCPTGDACVAEVCKARGALGAPCTVAEDCAGTCDPASGTAPPKCRVGYCTGE